MKICKKIGLNGIETSYKYFETFHKPLFTIIWNLNNVSDLKTVISEKQYNFSYEGTQKVCKSCLCWTSRTSKIRGDIFWRNLYYGPIWHVAELMIWNFFQSKLVTLNAFVIVFWKIAIESSPSESYSKIHFEMQEEKFSWFFIGDSIVILTVYLVFFYNVC